MTRWSAETDNPSVEHGASELPAEIPAFSAAETAGIVHQFQAVKILVVAEKPSACREIAAALLGVTADKGTLFRGRTPLGDEVTVSCARGHVLELAKPEAYNAVHGKSFEKWRLADLPITPRDGWEFEEVPRPDAGKVLETLRGLMREHEGGEVVNACDAGREGELIFRKVLSSSGIDVSRTRLTRMWYLEMTARALQDAYRARQPLSQRDGLGMAGYTRDQADWLSGMNKTVLATKTLPRGRGGWKVWSVGRVQTPTLALIYERDRAIAFFKPQDFWEAYGVFEGINAKADLEAYAKSTERAVLLGVPQISEDRERKVFWREDLAQAFAGAARAPATYKVSNTSSTKTANPPLPFDLQEASKFFAKRFSWTSKQSLEVLQSLYEAKLISYPRTDSRFFPDTQEMKAKVGDGLRAAIAWIQAHQPRAHMATQALLSQEQMEKARAFKNVQSDHYGLHPTSEVGGLAHVNRDQLIAWMAVVQACAMALDEPAKSRVITRRWEQVNASGPYAPCVFRTTRENLVHPGWKRWKKVEGGEAEEGGEPSGMPPLQKEQEIQDVELRKLETSPPKPFSEDTLLDAMKYAGESFDEKAAPPERIEELIEAMKDRGIGTPATRAAIIETLLARGYIERKGRQIVSTPNGRMLIRELKRLDPLAVSARQTAEWELELKKMERGESKYTRETFLDEILKQFLEVQKAYTAASTRLGEADAPELVEGRATGVLCPKSGQPILDRGAAWEAPGLPGALLWKGAFGRSWSAEEFRELLAEISAGKAKRYEDLKTREGRAYSALIGWNAESNKFSLVEPEPVKVKGMKCPKSGKLLLDRGNHFEAPGFPGVRLWKDAMGRSWTAEDYVRLLDGVVRGAPALFEGLVSKRTGKAYKARLTVDETARRIVVVLGPLRPTPASGEAAGAAG